MQPPAMRALLTINVVFYVLWSLALIYIAATRAFVVQQLALNPAWPDVLLHPWQLLSYSFIHMGTGLGGFLHLLFNMLWLYWMGKEYEELHGSHRLLALYVLGAVGGALLTVALHNLFPTLGFFGGPVHGASASVLAIMMAVAILYPYKSVGLFLIGPVRLLYVVLGFLALDLLFLSGGGTSVSAHFGGALFGFLFARAEQRGIDLTGWARVFFERPARSRAASGRGGRADVWARRADAWRSADGPSETSRTATVHRLRRTEPAAPPAPEAYTPSDVDRILDKISAHGYEALSEEERRILYEASKK